MRNSFRHFASTKSIAQPARFGHGAFQGLNTPRKCFTKPRASNCTQLIGGREGQQKRPVWSKSYRAQFQMLMVLWMCCYFLFIYLGIIAIIMKSGTFTCGSSETESTSYNKMLQTLVTLVQYLHWIANFNRPLHTLIPTTQSNVSVSFHKR